MRPQRESSVTSTASISRRCASAITFFCSARSSLAPEAVSLRTPLYLIAGAGGEGGQIALLPGARLIGGRNAARAARCPT
jgi:hypothetical protein